MSDRRHNPESLPPRRAVERYLRRRSTDATESSVRAWRYRLKLFVEWTDGLGIDSVGAIQGYDLDEYYELRSSDVAPSTLEGEMWTLKKFFEYLEQIEAVEDGLSEKVRIPDVDEGDRSNDVRLAAEDAIPLLQHLRNSDDFGSRAHALLELAWHTGARQGGIRALDLRDVHLDEQFVEFKHRPDTETPLKNKRRGERPVALPSTVMDVLEAYIDENRWEVRDDHDREPLISSTQGRPGKNTIRTWCYVVTLPCQHGACPHGKLRDTCEYTDFAHASKCPSSRSLHRVRTGSITWQLDQGIPPEVVAERVNASLEVIEHHYDKQTPRERMERRRRPYVEELEFGDD